jgi:hypothetical protein
MFLNIKSNWKSVTWKSITWPKNFHVNFILTHFKNFIQIYSTNFLHTHTRLPSLGLSSNYVLLKIKLPTMFAFKTHYIYFHACYNHIQHTKNPHYLFLYLRNHSIWTKIKFSVYNVYGIIMDLLQWGSVGMFFFSPTSFSIHSDK